MWMKSCRSVDRPLVVKMDMMVDTTIGAISFDALLFFPMSISGRIDSDLSQ